MTQPAAKRPRGRPVEHQMPEPIPDTPEEHHAGDPGDTTEERA